MSLRKLAVGTSGVYIAYITSSLLSQKLYSSEYQSISNPESWDKYTYPELFVWFSSLLCALYGFAKGKIDQQAKNPIPIKQQLILGLLYTFNILCASSSLLYISFPDQTLGRNTRYLAVVLVGVYFSRVKKGSNVKLSSKKILVASIITIGVLIFTVFGDQSKKAKHVDPAQEWKGYVLLALSVIADALFSDSQAYSKVHYKPTANNLFYSANLYTFIFVFVFSIFTGQGLKQIRFCIDHPAVMGDILIISVLQVIGQISIYFIVANFKQHMFPLVSTTRKIFTILLSIVVFGHYVNIPQWFSILLVFGGLVYELYEELSGKKAKTNEKEQVKLDETKSNTGSKSPKRD